MRGEWQKVTIFLRKFRGSLRSKQYTEKGHIKSYDTIERFIVMGKGGTGKTTISAVLARALSSAGHDTLAVSLDPAHNLGDVLGYALDDKPKKVSDKLFAFEVDLDTQVRRFIDKKLDQTRPLYGHLQIFNADKFLKALEQSPGMEEFALLEAIKEIGNLDQMHGAIVLDTPPTGMTLRLLTLPDLTLLWIDELMGLRKKILERRAYLQHIEGSGKKIDNQDDPVMAELQRYRCEIKDIKSFLHGEGASILLVLQVDKLSVKETERTIKKLSTYGYGVRACLINKAPKEDPFKAYASSGLDDLMKAHGEISWIELPDLGEKISTPQGLNLLGKDLINFLHIGDFK